MPETSSMPDIPQFTEARWSETRVFSLILVVIFVAAMAVLLVLPWLLPGVTNAWVRSFVAGGLLTLICAPIVWRVIVEPLRTLAASERAKADAIVRTAADGILTFDAGGVVSSFNAAAEGLFGCPRAEALGRNVAEFLPDCRTILERMERGAGGMETLARRRDGTTRPVEVAVSHTELSGGRLLTGIVRDISERRRIEGELQQAHAAQEQAHRDLAQAHGDLEQAHGDLEQAHGDLESRVQSRTAALAQANAQVQRQSELIGSVLASIPYSVYWKNRDGLFLGCNDKFALAAGLAGAQQILGLVDEDLDGDVDEARRFRRLDAGVMTDGEALLNTEEARRQADGPPMVALTSRVPMRDHDGRVIGVLGIFGDITERKQVEADRQASEERLRSLVRNVSDIFAVLDADGAVQYVSPAVETTLGYAAEMLSGRCFFDLVAPEDRARARQMFHDTCGGVGDGSGEAQMLHADGTPRAFEILGCNLLSDPAIRGVLVTCRDVTERKAFEGQLVHQAFHDALTGLPNRALFSDRLARALTRAERQGTLTAVIFLDLDNFKVINDSLGHEAGDRLLTSVAERLRACVRVVDTVSRLGGDEFTILLEDLVDEREVAEVAERVIEQLLAPTLLLEREVFTSVSVGVAISRGEYAVPDDLLRDADTAMYQAKTGGKGCAVTFEGTMNTHALERLELETDMRRALENGEFRVFYQPIMGMDSGEISGVEALVRWQHPKQGLIPPGRFIPLAEETGLILALGRWVLAEACRQAVRWRRESPETASWVMSVNLSARQLQQEDLVEDIAGILAATGMDPHRLKLEITESVMMSDAESTLDKLHALKALGVKLAVDDFGTGYSSMAYLSSLPIDTLKIDRSFINKIGLHPDGEAIVRTIVSLAKMLNLQVTSEGIETDAQRAYLQDLDCDWGQGYLYAHPLSEGEVGEMLHARNAQTRAGALPPPTENMQRAA